VQQTLVQCQLYCLNAVAILNVSLIQDRSCLCGYFDVPYMLAEFLVVQQAFPAVV
jgi:hypothetical protein